MTKDEFIAYETDDGPVRLTGDLFDGELLMVKAKGDNDAALATRDQYESFAIGFAHAYADDGSIMRYRSVIGDIAQIVPVSTEHGRPKD